jgi:hypothetical protein
MIRKITTTEFVRMLDIYLRSSNKVKEDENFKIVDIDLSGGDNFLEVEVSKK